MTKPIDTSTIEDNKPLTLREVFEAVEENIKDQPIGAAVIVVLEQGKLPALLHANITADDAKAVFRKIGGMS